MTIACLAKSTTGLEHTALLELIVDLDNQAIERS